MEVAPAHSGLIYSISNTCSALAGIAGTILVGVLTTVYPGAKGWRIAFLIAFGQCIFAVVLWYFFQSSEIVPELNCYVTTSSQGSTKIYKPLLNPALYEDCDDDDITRDNSSLTSKL